MIPSSGYAALQQHGALVPYRFERREPGPRDILVEIRFCGICHSDLHAVDNDWGFHEFPLVPGHEIVGVVVARGSKVSKFEVGDWAGIGSLTDSCGACCPCERGLEVYCEVGVTPSFGARDRQGEAVHGGLSSNYVVREDFALRIPDGLDPASAAPLLCGGITTWSPMRLAGIGAGWKVGVVGLGGLGHLAVKWARALGAEVVVFSTTPDKAADALRLGAHETVLSTDAEAMAAHAGSFDYIMDTVSAAHDLTPYILALALDGTLCLAGMPAEPAQVSAMLLGAGRRKITSSMTGGIAETQEMLDFAAAHRLGADIEILRAGAVQDAFDRLKRNDVRYRFVIDMADVGVPA